MPIGIIQTSPSIATIISAKPPNNHTHTQHIDNRNWSQHACNAAFANCLVKGNYPAEGKTIGGKFALCLHPSSDPLLIDMSPQCGGVCHLTRCQGSKIRPIFMPHGDSNANIATTTTRTSRSSSRASGGNTNSSIQCPAPALDRHTNKPQTSSIPHLFAP